MQGLGFRVSASGVHPKYSEPWDPKPAWQHVIRLAPHVWEQPWAISSNHQGSDIANIVAETCGSQ